MLSHTSMNYHSRTSLIMQMFPSRAMEYERQQTPPHHFLVSRENTIKHHCCLLWQQLLLCQRHLYYYQYLCIHGQSVNSIHICMCKGKLLNFNRIHEEKICWIHRLNVRYTSPCTFTYTLIIRYSTYGSSHGNTLLRLC